VVVVEDELDVRALGCTKIVLADFVVLFDLKSSGDVFFSKFKSMGLVESSLDLLDGDWPSELVNEGDLMMLIGIS